MPPEAPRPGRIDLADPGHRPRRPTARRRLLAAGLAVALAGAAFGAYLARGPIGRGASAAAEAVWGAWEDWSSELQDRADAVPETTTTTTAPPPAPVPSRSALAVLGSGEGDAAFALLHQPPDGPAAMVLIPQTLLVQVPGYGEFSMAQALGFGGPSLARLALANETGIRIDDVVPVPAGGTAAVAESLVVDVPVELYVEGGEGSRRLIAPGPQELSTDLVELLLSEPGEGNQFDWLQRQEAVWDGLLTVVDADPSAAAALVAGAGDPDGAAALLRAVAAEGRIDVPPVDRVAVGAGRDALVLATDRIDDYLAGDLGHLLLREGRRPRVEVLNGNGVAGSGAAVAERLVAGGFYVFRSGNADRFDHETSLVIAQGEHAAAGAREAADLLGIAEVVQEARAPSGVVDVSIIVGTDLASKEG
ncbi:MAG: LCP family protein [Actinobacteria bacterium]|nr:LCP family protein [Actinomycetota bacterium]